MQLKRKECSAMQAVQQLQEEVQMGAPLMEEKDGEGASEQQGCKHQRRSSARHIQQAAGYDVDPSATVCFQELTNDSMIKST